MPPTPTGTPPALAAPTPALPRTRSGRARLAVVLALVGLVLLAGCSAVTALGDLQGELEAEGFRDVSANISSSSASVLVIEAKAPLGESATEAQDQAAEVVWTRFPRRFEALQVTIDGEGREWAYAELEEELGARPDDLDTSTEIGDELTRSTVYVLLGMLVAGVVAVALIGVVVFLVVRANRRRAATRPTPRPQPWMPTGVPGAPMPPPGGWAPASAPPAPPSPDAPPTPDAPPSLAKPPPTEPAAAPPSWEQPPPVPPAPPAWTPPTPPTPSPAPAAGRTRDPDARRLGRRPRGPVPDKAHTPPGWG